MYYIKCSHCGHLNEVKSEYQVFCSGCNKKLENNFSDWKKRNPGKTFDEYKQLVCVSENEIQSVAPVKESKPRKGLLVFIGIAAIAAIAYAIGSLAGDTIVRFLKYEKTSKEVLGNDWIKKTYGFGLTVETPVIMTEAELPIPDNVMSVIEKYEAYNYNSAKGFKVLINSIKYKPVVGELSLQGAANGSVNEMKMQKGVSGFDYTEASYSKGDIPGFIQKGTYKQDGIEIEFINTGFMKGLILWQVFVAYQSDDEVGRIAAQKVIDSIEISEDSSATDK
jgi:hypothetical protein